MGSLCHRRLASKLCQSLELFGIQCGLSTSRSPLWTRSTKPMSLCTATISYSAQANESSSVLQIPGSARAIQGPKRSRALLPREKNQDAPFKSVCPAIINGDRLTQHCRKIKRRCTSGSNLSYRSQPIHKVPSNPPSHRKRWAGPNLNL